MIRSGNKLVRIIAEHRSQMIIISKFRSASVVQKHNPYIARNIVISKRIHVIKERQISHYTKYGFSRASECGTYGR